MTNTWCETCSEFKYAQHKCPPQWHVWSIDDEDPGSSFEDTRIVYARSSEEAAKKFAQLECDSNPDYYDSYIKGPRAVAVRAKDGGDTVVFNVRGEATVDFYADTSKVVYNPRAVRKLELYADEESAQHLNRGALGYGTKC